MRDQSAVVDANIEGSTALPLCRCTLTLSLWRCTLTCRTIEVRYLLLAKTFVADALPQLIYDKQYRQNTTCVLRFFCLYAYLV